MFAVSILSNQDDDSHEERTEAHSPLEPAKGGRIEAAYAIIRQQEIDSYPQHDKKKNQIEKAWTPKKAREGFYSTLMRSHSSLHTCMQSGDSFNTFVKGVNYLYLAFILFMSMLKVFTFTLF